MKLLKRLALYMLMAISIGSCAPNLRSKVVTLVGREHGLCSGVQVHTPKGNDYILTAAHCHVLKDSDGQILASFDGQRQIPRKVIEESPVTDLMLLEGIPNVRGVDVADDYKLNEQVFSLTHGKGYATYESKGEIIQLSKEKILISPIFSESDEEACTSQPKQIVENVRAWIFEVKACVLYIDFFVTNVLSDPGSSGGPLFNHNDKLLGIVSGGDEHFTLFVPLKDIQALLKPY